MNIVHSAAELSPGPGGVCLALGVFDGLHLGHQSVIARALGDAKNLGATAAVVTFDRHPNAIVAPGQVPPFIYPQARKLEVIAGLGVDTCCVIRFDQEFSQVEGEAFVRGLARTEKIVRSISVGETFKFGRRRSGDVSLLRRLAAGLNFSVNAVPDVMFDGMPVSSTRIREAVRAGRFDLAGRLLGRPYGLCGTVVAGAQAGRKLGFPTANLNVAGVLVPPGGVYAATARTPSGAWRAAVNIGLRPTLCASPEGLSVEAHLLDFSENIYGRELELQFLAKLRDEIRFSSVEALRTQIEKDVAAVRALPPPAATAANRT